MIGTAEIVKYSGNGHGGKIDEISIGPFTATPVGLQFAEGLDIPFDIWLEYGEGLHRVQTGLQWIIGDWLNFGEHKYGETYDEALKIWPEYEQDTLRIYKMVSHKVPLLVRTNNLKWQHHYEVRSMDLPTMSYWLKQAEKNNWGYRTLRQMIYEDRQREKKDSKGQFTWAKDEVVLNGWEGIKAIEAMINTLSHATIDVYFAGHELKMLRKKMAMLIQTIDLAIGEDDERPA